MNNILVGIAVVLIALMTALFAVPTLIDWNGYRGVIEEEATRLLGRDVRVGGQVSVRLLPIPTFSVEQIRVADTQSNSGEPFFRAEAISGKLAVAPLIRGLLQASEIVLKKPQFNLVYDEQGRGNWTSFGGKASRRLFIPSDVALQSVRIEGGVLALDGADHVERIRLEQVDGELSATALEGPYRFRGTFGADGTRRELRLTTTRPEPDGTVRFKAGLKYLESGAVYTFDARATNLGATPRIEGELVAQVPLPQFSGMPAAGAQPGAATLPRAEEAPVEVKANVSADARLVHLGDLTLAFERLGRPQILTGEAEFDLGATKNVRAALAAKWLDIDQMIGVSPAANGVPQASEPKHGPISGLITLATRLNGFVPETGQISLILDVEQANLGAEPVSGLRLVLAGRSGETTIQELRLGLPGGARADLKGLMTGNGEETSFNGDIVLRGASLARFLSWSTAGGFALEAARDGRFSMRSKLSAAPGGIVAKEFVGELAGTVVQGELGYKWAARREISILVEGPQVDLRPLMSAPAAGARTSLLGQLTASAGLSLATKDLDAVYRVRAGQLILPTAVYQDAAADIEFRNERVRIQQLKLATDTGVTVDLEGDVPTSAAQAAGTIRGAVSARDAASLAILADFLGVPADILPEKSRWGALVPATLAGSVSFGLAGDAPVSVVADGDLAGAHLRFKANAGKGLQQIRSSLLDLSASLSGAAAERVLDALLGLTPADESAATRAPGASIVLDATGVPDRGLAALGTWTSNGLKASFHGKALTRGPPAAAGQTPALDLSGDTVVEASDVNGLRRFWRGAPRVSVAGVSALLRARLESSATGVRIAGLTGRIGNSSVGGDVRVAAVDGKQRMEGAIELAALHVPTVLSLLSAPDAAGPKQAGIWPETRLTLGAVAGLEGELAVRVRRVGFYGDIGVDDGRFAVAFAPNRVEVRDFEGRGGGGRWSGGLQLALGAADGGAEAMLSVKLEDGQLASITGPAVATGASRQPPVSGSVAGALTLSGKGLSVQDLFASLSGRGSVVLGDLRTAGLTPVRLADALDAALKGPSDALVVNLRRKLAEAPSDDLSGIVPGRTIAVTVARGVASAPPMQANTPSGRSTISLALDLASLDVSGSERIEAIPKPTSAASWTATVAAPGAAPATTEPPLPPVVTTFSARAGMFHVPTVALSSEALERELAVRKLERDSLELERIRKQDEERERLELERRSQAIPPAPTVNGGPAPAPSTVVTSPQSVDPTAPAPMPVAAPPAPAAAAPAKSAQPPAPKPAFRPMTDEERKRIFGGN